MLRNVLMLYGHTVKVLSGSTKWEKHWISIWPKQIVSAYFAMQYQVMVGPVETLLNPSCIEASGNCVRLAWFIGYLLLYARLLCKRLRINHQLYRKQLLLINILAIPLEKANAFIKQEIL